MVLMVGWTMGKDDPAGDPDSAAVAAATAAE